MSISDKRFPGLVIKLGLLKPTASFTDLWELQNKLTDGKFIWAKANAMPPPNPEFPAMLPDLMEILEALTADDVIRLKEELAGVVPFTRKKA